MIGLISTSGKITDLTEKLGMETGTPKPKGQPSASGEKINAGQLRHQEDYTIYVQARRETNLSCNHQIQAWHLAKTQVSSKSTAGLAYHSGGKGFCHLT